MSGGGVALKANQPEPTAVFDVARAGIARGKLTPEQTEKFRDSYRELGEQIRVVREETNERVRSLYAQHTARLLPILSPEQRREYRQLIEERRAARRKP